VSIASGKAEEAIRQHLAQRLGWSVTESALGILKLANANMAEMVRLATLRRGLDPRDFVLVAFGGAGPLHATEIAREVGIPKVIVPVYPGLFSAVGTILGERRHDLVLTYLARVRELERAALLAGFQELEKKAAELMEAEGVGADDEQILERRVDLRFAGQLFELNVPVHSDDDLTAQVLERRFREKYNAVYGFDLPEHQVEVVNLRTIARTPVRAGSRISQHMVNTDEVPKHRDVWISADTKISMPIRPRDTLYPGEHLEGPAIIEDFGATIRVLERQSVTVGEQGTLTIEVETQ
jgi:N-methylhydantoinase A